MIYLDNTTLTKPVEGLTGDHWTTFSTPHMNSPALFPELSKALNNIARFIGFDNADRLFFRMYGKNIFPSSRQAEFPGAVHIKDVESAIESGAESILISYASPFTGLLNPIEEIKELCLDRSILFGLDLSLAHSEEIIEGFGADYIILKGDLIHGLQGTGIVVSSSPIFDEELSLPLTISLGNAALSCLEARGRISFETNRLKNKLEDAIPDAKVLFSDQVRIPFCTCITIPKIHQEGALYYLNDASIYPGSNLSALREDLLNSGIERDEIFSALYFGLSRYTDMKEIDSAIEKMATVIENLRGEK